MPGSRSEVSDGLPFLSLFRMATKDAEMSSDTVAREQGVTPKQKQQRQSRSNHRKARDGLSPAQASDDGRKTPTVDVEPTNVDKKSTKRTKKAGERSSKAPAIDKAGKVPMLIKGLSKRKLEMALATLESSLIARRPLLLTRQAMTPMLTRGQSAPARSYKLP